MPEYTVQRLGLHGDGIVPGPLFAPMTLPGEQISGEPDGSKLTDVRIITPSAARVAAPCRHFKACGGCQLQHASDDFVAEWKTDVVRSALKAHGLDSEIRPILTSPPNSRRRAGFAARRTKKGAMAGFHGRASDVIVEIPDCRLLTPAVLAGRELAEALAEQGGSRKGEMSVMVTETLGGLDVSVTGGKPLEAMQRQELALLCGRMGVARLCWNDEVVATMAPPLQRFGPAQVTPPPGAFLQATGDGEAALTAAVREIVADAGRVADLFAGSGTFSLPLARRAEVHAVEGEAAMLAALEQGWRGAEGLKPVTTETRDLFRRPLLPDELARFDAVVLDPPRAGAEAQTAEIARSGVARLAYVSCNPVSFARDVARLVEAGFALDWVQPVDQFRWSSHVELVAALTR